MIIKDYVDKLDHDTIKKIIQSYEQFDLSGDVRDSSPVTVHARSLMPPITSAKTTTWMQLLAFECAMNFANKYISAMPGESTLREDFETYHKGVYPGADYTHDGDEYEDKYVRKGFRMYVAGVNSQVVKNKLLGV